MKNFWRHPWGYPHASILTAGLFLTGVLLDIATQGPTLELPPWPANLMIILVGLGLIILMGILGRKNSLVVFFSGIPLATSSMALIGLLSLFAGILPQAPSSAAGNIYTPWFYRVVGSWPFVLAIGLFLFNLSLTFVRRATRRRWRDWWFLCVHGGLVMILLAMIGGSSDQQRLRMIIPEGQTARAAYFTDDVEGRYPVKMPFMIELKKFHMEEYAPRIAIIDARTGQIARITRNQWIETAPGSSRKLGPYQMSVLEYSATPHTAVVRITAPDNPAFAPIEGPLAVETDAAPPTTIQLPDGLAVVMIPPDPKKYRSDVVITLDQGPSMSTSIEVNKPYRLGGWRLYQSSYETQRGSQSHISILEVISDRWLNLAYAGSLLTLLGVLRLFWTGFETRTTRRREVQS